MDELNKRVIELMARLDMGKPAFAKELGVSVPLIIHIVTGRNKPGIDIIQKILSRFEDVSPDWLLLGKGQIYREKPRAIDHSTELDSLNRALSLLTVPQSTNKTMAGYYKLLMDELLHMQEMDSMIGQSDKNIEEIKKALERVKIGLVTK